MAKHQESQIELRELPTKLGPQRRAMSVDGYDPEARTVTMAISSEQPVERYFGTEILSHKPGAIRMNRLKGGMPLLFNHDPHQHLGVTTGHELGKDGVLRTVNKLGSNPLAREKEGDLKDGILKDVSLAYIIHKATVEEDDNGHRTVTATDWEPLENSLVTIPADPSVGVGRSAREAPDAIPVEYIFATRSAAVPAAEARMEGDDDEDEDDETEDDDSTPSDNSRTTQPEAQRTQTMAAEVTVDLAAENKTRVEGLRSLLKSNPKEFSADEFARYVSEDLPLARAKEAVADKIIANSQRSNVATIGDDVMGDLSKREQQSYSLRNVYCAAINERSKGTFKDKGAEAGLEREVSDQLRKKASERGVSGLGGGILIPSATVRTVGVQERALASGGNAGAATNFVNVDADPIKLLRSKTVCLALGAQMMTGLHGGVKLSRQNAAGQSNWLAEGGTVAETDPGFDAITMQPHRLSMYNSYFLELLAQSNLAVDSVLANDRMEVLARSLDFAALAGPGTGNSPLGMMLQTGIAAILSGTTRAANGTVTAGAGGVPLTYVDCNNFEAAISTQNGDIGTLGWALRPRVRAALRSTPKISGGLSDFIWPSTSSPDANGVQEGPLGYRAIASTAVPTGYTVNAVSGLDAVILGVWDQMLIGDWGLSELIVDPYTGAQQGLYKITEHGLYDTNIRHIESFAISTSVLPS